MRCQYVYSKAFNKNLFAEPTKIPRDQTSGQQDLQKMS